MREGCAMSGLAGYWSGLPIPAGMMFSWGVGRFAIRLAVRPGGGRGLQVSLLLAFFTVFQHPFCQAVECWRQVGRLAQGDELLAIGDGE